MGSTISAIVRIHNCTNSDIMSICAYDFDNFDFGPARPDRVFNGQAIAADSCIERKLDFSTLSTNCPFTMKTVFRNKKEDVFRVNYKCAFDGSEVRFNHLTRSHEFRFKKTGPRVLEIYINNTDKQLENIRAEELIEKGVKLMNLGRYNEASVNFVEAAEKANEKETLALLQQHNRRLMVVKESADVETKAKCLNNQGIQFLSSVNFHEALNKFDEALRFAKNIDTIMLIEDNLKIAKDAKLDQEAKKLNQEGLILRKNNQLEAAVTKFEEAARKANDLTIINSIKRNKSETLSILARDTLDEAWLSEAACSSDAIHLFSKSKFLFQQADSARADCDHQQFISLISCRIEGEKLFNTAVILEQEAAKLINKTMQTECLKDCNSAKDRYVEAWKCYKEAEKLFQEGLNKDQNFERRLLLTKQALMGIEKIIKELEIVLF